MIAFNQVGENVGDTSIVPDKIGAVTILTAPIDSIQFNNKISLIKLDAEGGEYDILLGAEQTFKKYKPVLIIEMWQKNVDKVSNLLNQMDYSLEEHLGGGG